MISTETSGVTTSTSGARLVQLKDICDRITKGSTPTSYGFKYTRDGIRFIKAENIDKHGLASTTTDYIDETTNEFLKRSILQEHDILFSIAGTIGRVGIIRRADLPANTNQALAIVRLRPGIVEQRYLFYYLKSDAIQKHALKRIVGVGRANLSLTNIGEFAVPLVSLDQQKQIVAEIEKQFSRLDEAVANLRRVKANLKRYRAAVLKAAVEGKLTEVWRKQHPNIEPASKLLECILAERRAKWKGTRQYNEPSEPDTGGRSSLPKGWASATVAQLTPADRPCAYGVLQPGEHVALGIPLVRVGDINDGVVNQSELKRIAPKIAARYPRTKLRGGEVVISLVGAIGRTAVIPKTLLGANTARAVGVIPLTSRVSAPWIEIWFRNPAKIAEMTAKSHEVARKTLNLEDVRDASVALPSAEEQNEIVAEVERRLSVIGELEIAIEANLTRAERLRQSILHEAFTGRL
jgi:type I restriction enzyme, S subunit